MLALAVGRQRGERSASFAAHFLVPNPTANPVGDRGRFAFRRSPAVVNSAAGFFVEARSHSSCIAPSLRPTQSRESRRYTRRDGHRTGFLARPVLPPGPTRGFEAPGSVFKDPDWRAEDRCAPASFALPILRTSRIFTPSALRAAVSPSDGGEFPLSGEGARRAPLCPLPAQGQAAASPPRSGGRGEMGITHGFPQGERLGRERLIANAPHAGELSRSD